MHDSAVPCRSSVRPYSCSPQKCRKYTHTYIPVPPLPLLLKTVSATTAPPSCPSPLVLTLLMPLSWSLSINCRCRPKQHQHQHRASSSNHRLGAVRDFRLLLLLHSSRGLPNRRVSPPSDCANPTVCMMTHISRKRAQRLCCAVSTRRNHTTHAGPLSIDSFDRASAQQHTAPPGRNQPV